jgi:hypothetical protein
MHKQWLSYKKANQFSLFTFLLGLGCVGIGQIWWPNIVLVLGASLVVRQVVLGKLYDAFLASFLFLGVFFTQKYQTFPKVTLPVVFFTGALFVALREFLDRKQDPIDQQEENLNHEIEESQQRDE